MIDWLDITWVSALGINMGTYKNKPLFVTLISVAIVMIKKSQRLAVLKVIWNPKTFGTFLMILKHSNRCSNANWLFNVPLLASILWFLISICFKVLSLFSSLYQSKIVIHHLRLLSFSRLLKSEVNFYYVQELNHQS